MLYVCEEPVAEILSLVLKILSVIETKNEKDAHTHTTDSFKLLYLDPLLNMCVCVCVLMSLVSLLNQPPPLKLLLMPLLPPHFLQPIQTLSLTTMNSIKPRVPFIHLK